MQCDWFDKEADGPIAGQDKVKWENQTRDTGKKKDGVRGVASETGRGNRRKTGGSIVTESQV